MSDLPRFDLSNHCPACGHPRSDLHSFDAGETLPGWGDATDVDRIARKCKNPECRHVWNEAPLSAGGDDG